MAGLGAVLDMHVIRWLPEVLFLRLVTIALFLISLKLVSDGAFALGTSP